MADKDVRTVVDIPESLRRAARSQAVLSGYSLKAVVAALLRGWVSGRIQLSWQDFEQGDQPDQGQGQGVQ